MVTVINWRAVAASVLLLILAFGGLVYVGYRHAPAHVLALRNGFVSSRNTLIETGWTRAAGGQTWAQARTNCLLLDKQGCRGVYTGLITRNIRASVGGQWQAVPALHRWSLYASLAALAAGLALLPMYRRRRPLYDAHFASVREAGPLRVRLSDASALLLGFLGGRVVGLNIRPLADLWNLLVTSGTGGGKSSQLISALLSNRLPAIAVDVKGELYHKTSGWRARNVGKVFSVSPDGHGQHLDPCALWLACDPEAAPDLAHFLVYDPTDHPKFFSLQTKPALLAMIRGAQLEGQPLIPYLHRLLSQGSKGAITHLTSLGDPEIDAHLTQFLNVHPKEFPEGAYADTRGPVFSVWQTLSERLGPFFRTGTLDLMSGSDISMFDLVQGGTLYIRWPQARLEADAKPLGLIVHSLLTALVTHAERRGGALPTPLLLALDEIAQYEVPALPVHIATLRSRGIFALLYVQSRAQLRHGYGADGAKTILDNCDVQLYLKPKPDDAKAISERLGRVSIPSERKSRQRGERSRVTEAEVSYDRPLLTPDEVERVGAKRGFLFTGTYRPVLLRPARYFKHRRLRRRAKIAALPLRPYAPEREVVPPQAPDVEPKQTPPTFVNFDESTLSSTKEI